MTTSRIAYTFLGSFLGTIFCLQWWQQSTYQPWIWALLIIGLALSVIIRVPHTPSPVKTSALFSAASIFGITVALTVVARTTHVSTKDTVDFYAHNQFVTISGYIAAEPDRRPMQTKYTVEATELRTASGKVIPVSGNILATDRRQWPEYNYGDPVTVRGILEKPGAIEEFQYDRFLSRYDIYAVMYRAGFEAQNHKAPINSIHSKIFSTLFALKATFEAQTNRLYPEPHASFMAGLLTGSRKGIPEHLMQDFNTTGLTHIIAISGYNITIIISIIAGLLFWLPFKWRFIPSVIAIIAFTLFVGASAAVVRASIMGVLGLLALQLGRQSTVRLTVLWTLFFMLIYNPKYLWYDAGFQLSFLAVIGLTELANLLDKWFAKIPKTLGAHEALQMTCAAQLAAVPLIVLLFGRLSLVAPIANVLVAPFIPLAMLFGFLATAVSFVAFPLGQLIAYPGWGCLEWIILVAKHAAQIPYASIDIPHMNIFLIIIYYIALFAWLSWHNHYTATN